MEILTIAAFFAWGLVGYLGGLYVAARIKPTDPRVIEIGKRLAYHEIEVADLRDLYERLMKSHKRLRSSAGMAKLRGMKPEEPAGNSNGSGLAHKSEAEILRELKLR
jgi:hypothetical protein